MEELQVVVNQTPGVIRWNFDELKTALSHMMETYTGLVYTEESIPAAKADVAMLRKLRKAVEDKRKEIKEKCLEPYSTVEAQAKELTGIIDEPINLIAKQVSDYETRQKAIRKGEILKYMGDRFSGLPEGIAKKAQFKIYDQRWENATAKKKDWMAAIDACLDDINRSLGIIRGIDEEFRNDALAEYGVNLELSAAIAKAQALQQQKARILETERRRQEEAERRKRETEEAATRQAAEEAARAKVQPQTTTPTMGQVIENIERSAFKAATVQTTCCAAPATPEPLPWDDNTSPSVNMAQNVPQAATTLDDGSILVRIYGTPEEQKSILEYCSFMGVRCEKM